MRHKGENRCVCRTGFSGDHCTQGQVIMYLFSKYILNLSSKYVSLFKMFLEIRLFSFVLTACTYVMFIVVEFLLLLLLQLQDFKI